MRFVQTAAIALTGLALSVPALADGARSGDLPIGAGSEASLWHDALQESDVTLLLDYLRAAMRAAAEGREIPPPPEELKKRAESLASELKSRGTLSALLILSAIEEKARTLLREGAPPPRRALPPVKPFIPI